MANLEAIIEDSFQQYAGAVLQSRALVDVRDCLKPSARQIFYCMNMCKYTSNKPYQSTAAVVGDSMKYFYIHGDTSCAGIIMHAAQPFAMRYPIVNVSGNVGNLMASGNWAAYRYTKSRLSPLGDSLFIDIKKDTIEDWRDNFADTEQYPSVLPSKGYYNIVNPTMGIGIGAACSIPGFNLKEVNNAMTFLLWNPDATFEEIYCAPDFPTGATLLNEAEIKESLKNGMGKACKLRSTIDYDSNDRCLVVTEIPYGVYTNTICEQLETILNDDTENPGIERFNDLTGQSPLIKIYLKKKANPDRVLKYLYKNTSLQTHYGINMTMLDQGRFPKVFGWKEALQAHIDHEIEVYRRGFEFDLKKIKHRLHIIDGLFICMANIDEVVHTIKSSTSTAAASKSLCEKFLLDEEQAKAILDMKLSRLAHLEVQKLEKEKVELEKEFERLDAILKDERLLKLEVEYGFTEVAKKYGDARRTRIMNVEGEDDDVVEQKNIQVSLTNKNNLLISEVSSLYTQRRGGTGAKVKMDKGEYIIGTVAGTTTDTLMLFSTSGNSYCASIRTLPNEEKTAVESVIKISEREKICALATNAKNNTAQNILFFTKNGIIKKSRLSDYVSARAGSLKAIVLDADDEIVSVEIMNDEPVGMLTEQGQFVVTDTHNITALGRVAKGRKGIKLNDGDYLVTAKMIPSAALYVTSITEQGYTKRTSIEEFSHTALNTKGVRLQKFKEPTDKMVDFIMTANEASVIAIASKAQIKVEMSEIPLLSKGTIGNKLIKIKENEKIIGISKI